MKSLVLSSRFPWPAYTGDRLRATVWLSALAGEGEVTLVAPRGEVPHDAPPLYFCAAPRSLVSLIRRLVALLRDRVPLQCLLAAPYDWTSAIERARRDHGPFDATVVLLSRLHPWVREQLEGRTVLDAIDSLRRSADERRRAAGPLTSWLWRIEERRMARLESETARAYGRVVVISEEEIHELGDAIAVPMGIATRPLDDAPRAFDFGFWGRLPYFANADAARWILDEIWPAIRALRPASTLILGGADALASLRREAQRRGVPLVSPIDDVAAFARNIRVALMPVRYGTGVLSKVVEAAEAGCAIVATPHAMRGLAPLAKHVRIESTADGLAQAAVELLADDRTIGPRLRATVETHYARSAMLAQLAAVARGAQ